MGPERVPEIPAQVRHMVASAINSTTALHGPGVAKVEILAK